MDNLFLSTLMKVLLPSVAVVAVLLGARRRGIAWDEGLGLCKPGAKALLGWLAFWIAWIAVGEVVINTFGLDQAKPWPDYPLQIIVLRILAIGVAGPMAEEFVTRGLFQHLLAKTRLGPYGAIALLAVLWAAAHLQYGAGTVAMIALDGVVLGLARVRGGSLWIPVAMHVAGNCISIAQSLSG